MCGRFAIAPTDPEAWADIGEVFGPVIAQALAEMQARYNLAPTSEVPIVFRDASTGEPRLGMARWGFVPHWWREAQLPKFASINARSEDAAGKPAWRDAWRSARCLIPASHWYEWRQGEIGKQPYALSANPGRLFMFAGLYSIWTPPGGSEPLLSCAIITRKASAELAPIHDRMPVILHPRAWLPWLDARLRDAATVSALLEDHAVLEAETWPISTAVNSVRNDRPELLSRL